jgi:hypothetical protein
MAEESVIANLQKEFDIATLKSIIAMDEHGYESPEHIKYRDIRDGFGRKLNKLKLQQLEPKNDNHQTEQKDEQRLEAVLREIVKQRLKVIHETAELKLSESLHQEFENEMVKMFLDSIEFLKFRYTDLIVQRIGELRHMGQY